MHKIKYKNEFEILLFTFYPFWASKTLWVDNISFYHPGLNIPYQISCFIPLYMNKVISLKTTYIVFHATSSWQYLVIITTSYPGLIYGKCGFLKKLQICFSAHLTYLTLLLQFYTIVFCFVSECERLIENKINKNCSQLYSYKMLLNVHTFLNIK